MGHPGLVSGDMQTRTAFPTSSALVAVTYDEDRAILDVEFRQGETYRYFMVPRSVISDLIAARSVGRFFSERIRGCYKEQSIK